MLWILQVVLFYVAKTVYLVFFFKKNMYNITFMTQVTNILNLKNQIGNHTIHA